MIFGQKKIREEITEIVNEFNEEIAKISIAINSMRILIDYSCNELQESVNKLQESNDYQRDQQTKEIVSHMKNVEDLLHLWRAAANENKQTKQPATIKKNKEVINQGQTRFELYDEIKAQEDNEAAEFNPLEEQIERNRAILGRA